ncbi:MAG: hypothetical protein V7L11_17870 [Nostoc sp.]|uniref:hypothetical protein n=1 Tax=Nostoc sp. TaxID=1180 RepID=UPI002FF5C080
MLIVGAAASRTRGRTAFELHFQPPAGNEVLKEFQLKLTPMPKASNATFYNALNPRNAVAPQPTIFLQHFSLDTPISLHSSLWNASLRGCLKSPLGGSKTF